MNSEGYNENIKYIGGGERPRTLRRDEIMARREAIIFKLV